MKKKTIGVVVIILVLMTGGIIATSFAPKPLSQVAKIDKDEITQITFRSGSTGEFVETTDPQKITTLIHYLDQFQVQRKIHPIKAMGYSYYADFYSDKRGIVRITFREPLDVNNTSYNIIEPAFDFEYVHHFVMSLE